MAVSPSEELHQRQLPFVSLARDALRRVSFIKEAAWQIFDLLQTHPPTYDEAAHQKRARACHAVYQEMVELEEAFERAL